MYLAGTIHKNYDVSLHVWIPTENYLLRVNAINHVATVEKNIKHWTTDFDKYWYTDIFTPREGHEKKISLYVTDWNRLARKTILHT